MLAGHIPLADQIVEFFHGALATVMYISTSCTHMQALVRRMSFAATLLAHQYLPAPTIVMPFRSAVRACFIHHDAIRNAFQTLLTRIRTLISQIINAI